MGGDSTPIYLVDNCYDSYLIALGERLPRMMQFALVLG